MTLKIMMSVRGRGRDGLGMRGAGQGARIPTVREVWVRLGAWAAWLMMLDAGHRAQARA